MLKFEDHCRSDMTAFMGRMRSATTCSCSRVGAGRSVCKPWVGAAMSELSGGASIETR
jgi:hypothetical protein